MARIVIRADDLRDVLKQVASGVKQFPVRGNPLVEWRAGFGLRQRNEPRPTVGQSGHFRGNAWPALAPQYTRKTDGVTVPVWGGVPRATLTAPGGGQYQMLGVVTWAGSASIRKYQTKQQKKAGFGVVKVGQVVGTGRNVLGKLRPDGSRYKQSDKQMSDGQSVNHLFRQFASVPGVLSDNNRVIQVVSNKDYAAKVHDRRPFAWGPMIEREESDDALKQVSLYLDKLLKGI